VGLGGVGRGCWGIQYLKVQYRAGRNWRAGALGKGRDRKVWQTEGGRKCSWWSPGLLTSSPYPHHLPLCLSHTQTCISSSPLTHTHTHTILPLWPYPSATPSHTLINAKPESRGVGRGWTKQTPLQIGPFPWVCFEVGHVKLQGGCLGWRRPLSVTRDSVGKWDSLDSGQAGAAVPDSR